MNKNVEYLGVYEQLVWSIFRQKNSKWNNHHNPLQCQFYFVKFSWFYIAYIGSEDFRAGDLEIT